MTNPQFTSMYWRPLGERFHLSPARADAVIRELARSVYLRRRQEQRVRITRDQQKYIENQKVNQRLREHEETRMTSLFEAIESRRCCMCMSLNRGNGYGVDVWINAKLCDWCIKYYKPIVTDAETVMLELNTDVYKRVRRMLDEHPSHYIHHRRVCRDPTVECKCAFVTYHLPPDIYKKLDAYSLMKGDADRERVLQAIDVNTRDPTLSDNRIVLNQIIDDWVRESDDIKQSIRLAVTAFDIPAGNAQAISARLCGVCERVFSRPLPAQTNESMVNLLIRVCRPCQHKYRPRNIWLYEMQLILIENPSALSEGLTAYRKRLFDSRRHVYLQHHAWCDVTQSCTCPVLSTHAPEFVPFLAPPPNKNKIQLRRLFT